MKQIRIVCNDAVVPVTSLRFTTEWMEASLMNRWFLKMRLSEAVQTHGEGSHWVESREKEQVRELSRA
jgi:hypothetical protein